MGRRKKTESRRRSESAPAAISPRRAASNRRFAFIGLIVLLFFAGAAIARFGPQWLGYGPAAAPAETAADDAPPPPAPESGETPIEALARITGQGLVVNTHEHMENDACIPAWLEVMDKAGMKKTVLVGSSLFTITMNEKLGFTGYDENNQNLVDIARRYPGRFEAWPTINPLNPDKLDKAIALHQQGAAGFKLYTGHGYTRRDTGQYMFHPIAMDDPSMIPLYQYWQEHHIPICLHVNPFKPGFAQELVAVLDAFPGLKVIAPHFILSSIKESRLREFLDVYPNLYSDISFGHDDFLKAGAERISKSPNKFRRLFEDYPDRFMFGSDLVITEHEGKTFEWCMQRVQTYYDLLTKPEYTTPVVPGKTFKGLALRPELLDNILYRNYERFMALEPEGSKPRRALDWSKLGVERLDRSAGQAFPPGHQGGGGN